MRTLLRLLSVVVLFIVSTIGARADNVGIYVLPTNKIAAPVVNRTYTCDPTDGAFKRYDGSGVWSNLTLPKINLVSVTSPSVNDDSNDGYAVGSFWLDTLGAQFYVCTDASVGAASWAVFTSGAVSSTDLANGLKTKLTFADLFGDFKVSGFASTDPGASLAMTRPSGVAYVAGNRVVAGSSAFTYTASKDTYDYLQSDGTTNHIAVNNLASAPSGQPGLLMQKVVTNGSEITAVTLLAATAPSFSVGTATGDGDALSKGQADDLYAPISLTTSKTQAMVYGVGDGADGLPDFRLLTNGHLPVVDPAHGGMGTAITLNTLGIFYSNGSTGALMTAPTVAYSIPLTNSGNTGWTYISKPDLIAEAVAAAVDEIGGGGGGGGTDESFFGGGGTEGGIVVGTNSYGQPKITDYETFEIETGNVVDYTSGTVINCNSTAIITGTLNVGTSVAGGVGTDHFSSTEPGAGINGGRVGRVVDCAAGGGGGGCGGKGGYGGSDTSGTLGGLGGGAFDPGSPLTLRGLTGSGGAAGEAGTGDGGDGGDGGGFLSISAVDAVTIDGIINAKGADGTAGDTQAGGGAGGSGGVVEIYSKDSIVITGTIDLSGGDGGTGATATDGGGAGGGGGILVLFSPATSTIGGTITLTGGSAGANGTQVASAGEAGFILQIDEVPNEPLQLIHHIGGAFLLDEARKEHIATGSNVIHWSAAKYRSVMKKALTMKQAS